MVITGGAQSLISGRVASLLCETKLVIPPVRYFSCIPASPGWEPAAPSTAAVPGMVVVASCNTNR